MYIGGRTEPLASRLEPAFDSRARTRGLLGRSGLPADQALIIAPCQSVHTFWMKFPIDVIYAARDGRVLKIRAALPAWRVSAALTAFATIEMAAGSAAKAGLQVGHHLSVR